MGRGQRLLRYRFIFNFLLVVVSVAAGATGNPWIIGAAILILTAGAFALTWVTYQHNQIQPRSEELQTLLESEILPRLHKNANLAHPEAIPNLRANVMLLRWRGLHPRRHDFLVKPWQRTLKIEADYVSESAKKYVDERELEWTTNQGVVGDAMNERAEEVWTQPGYPDIDPRVRWNLSQLQYELTEHVNSVLSVPIYLPSDEDKTNPVGVVSLDSTAPPNQSRLHDEDLDIRDEAIYWSNVIGSVVE